MQLWPGCVKRRDQAAQGHDLAQPHSVDPDQLPLGPRLAGIANFFAPTLRVFFGVVFPALKMPRQNRGDQGRGPLVHRQADAAEEIRTQCHGIVFAWIFAKTPRNSAG